MDSFNYDTMKTTLLERFDLFHAAPFTIQRLSELLNEPKKHYCRLDKFMRALEKNILGNYVGYTALCGVSNRNLQLSVQLNRDIDKWVVKTVIQSMEIR